MVSYDDPTSFGTFAHSFIFTFSSHLSLQLPRESSSSTMVSLVSRCGKPLAITRISSWTPFALLLACELIPALPLLRFTILRRKHTSILSYELCAYSTLRHSCSIFITFLHLYPVTNQQLHTLHAYTSCMSFIPPSILYHYINIPLCIVLDACILSGSLNTKRFCDNISALAPKFCQRILVNTRLSRFVRFFRRSLKISQDRRKEVRRYTQVTSIVFNPDINHHDGSE